MKEWRGDRSLTFYIQTIETWEVKILGKFISSFAILGVIGAFAISYYIQIMGLEQRHKTVVEFLLIGLFVLLIFRVFVTTKAFIQFRKTQTAPSTNANSSSAMDNIVTKLKVFIKQDQVIFIIASALFVALFQVIGFFTTAFLYVLVLNILLGTRGRIKLIAIPTGLCIAIYLLFVLALGIRLPTGILF